jgi:hypothetical protein
MSEQILQLLTEEKLSSDNLEIIADKLIEIDTIAHLADIPEGNTATIKTKLSSLVDDRKLAFLTSTGEYHTSEPLSEYVSEILGLDEG